MRRVYFSFDYQRDLHRVKQICQLPGILSRSAGGFKNPAVWRQVNSEGDAAVRGLINDALMNTSVTIVCIGFRTTFGKYLGYEIERSLEQGSGLLGVTISRIPDQKGLVDPYAPVPEIMEGTGFNVYPFTRRDQLVAQIDEAAELAKLDRVERLNRKLAPRVSRRKKDKRRERREDVVDGLVEFVEIEGDLYPIKNWNSQGFMAMFYHGDLREGTVVEIFFSVPLAEKRVEMNCQAAIRRVDRRKNEIAASFINMDNDTRAMLSRRFGEN